VPTDPEARLAAFTAFVRRALDRAQVQQNMSVEQVARKAGIGVNTLYLWRNGNQWKQFPKGETVEALCDALGIKPEVAFTILWPGKDEKPSEPIPLGPDEDLVTLARRLADPTVSPQEKYHIRETIRSLAARSGTPEDIRRRRDAG
jgi:transcriptional regulator with XRE-family HTH domain